MGPCRILQYEPGLRLLCLSSTGFLPGSHFQISCALLPFSFSDLRSTSSARVRLLFSCLQFASPFRPRPCCLLLQTVIFCFYSFSIQKLTFPLITCPLLSSTSLLAHSLIHPPSMFVLVFPPAFFQCGGNAAHTSICFSSCWQALLTRQNKAKYCIYD